MDANIREKITLAVLSTPAARAREAQEERERAAEAAAWQRDVVARTSSTEAAAVIAAAAAAEAVYLERLAELGEQIAAYARASLGPVDEDRWASARATVDRARALAAETAEMTRLAAEMQPVSNRYFQALMGWLV
jgi:hypothetical protein